MTKAKTVKKTKAVEIEEFTAEVRNYVKTGQSTILTAKEKAKLDKIRVIEPVKTPSMLDKFFEYLKK
jgi:hypothetical protein